VRVEQAMQVNMPRRALVLTPMRRELRPVVAYARARRTRTAGLTAYTARVGGVEVLIARLGVGKESSRTVADRLLATFEVDHVLISGIAGGIMPGLSIGTLVVPETVMDLDTGKRYESAQIAGVERRGIAATTDRLITNKEEIERLRALGVVAVDMESSSVAAACEVAGLPWTAFRAISDHPEHQLADRTLLSLLRDDGSTDVVSAAKFMVRHPRRVPGVMRLARDSSTAASQAARRTLEAIRMIGEIGEVA